MARSVRLSGAERRAALEGCRNEPRINVPTIVMCVSVWLASGASGLADSNSPTALLSVSTNLSASQKLTPEEAEQALKRLKPLRETILVPGTWRSTTLEFEPDAPDTNVIPGWLASSDGFRYGWPTSTNVTHYVRLPDGRRFMRNEITECNQSGVSQSKLYVRHEEGCWALLKRVAILYPEEKKQEKKKSPVEQGVAKSYDPYDQVTGERIKEGDRVRLRIIQSISEPRYRELVKEMKKEVPLLFRPFFTTSLIELGMKQIVPCRVETIMDEQSGDLIVIREYRKDGKPLREEQGWLLVDDLPAEAYAVPEGVKQFRPKTRSEARRLEEKARTEETRSAKKK